MLEANMKEQSLVVQSLIYERVSKEGVTLKVDMTVKMLSDWNNPGDLLKHQKKKRVSKCLENIEKQRRISQEIKDTLKAYFC